MIHISSPALFFDSRPAGHFDIIVVTYDKPWVAGWAGYFTDEHLPGCAGRWPPTAIWSKESILS